MKMLIVLRSVDKAEDCVMVTEGIDQIDCLRKAANLVGGAKGAYLGPSALSKDAFILSDSDLWILEVAKGNEIDKRSDMKHSLEYGIDPKWGWKVAVQEVLPEGEQKAFAF